MTPTRGHAGGGQRESAFVGRVRVVVVDDHALARAAVRTILADDPLFEVVAEAENADGAFAAVQRHLPDLVLMDIRMPGGGLEATRRIKESFPDVRIVVMTVSDRHAICSKHCERAPKGICSKTWRPTNGRRICAASSTQARRFPVRWPNASSTN